MQFFVCELYLSKAVMYFKRPSPVLSIVATEEETLSLLFKFSSPCVLSPQSPNTGQKWRLWRKSWCSTVGKDPSSFFNWFFVILFIFLLKYSWCTILCYRCTIEWFTILKGYTPFIVIVKYWLHPLCCTIYPCSLFILYIIVCTS